MSFAWKSFIGIALGVFVSLAGMANVASAAVELTSAGSTFVQPLIETMAAQYRNLHSDVKINYGGGGSGQGIKGITDKTLVFAGSDAPMNDKELAGAGGAGNIIQIPSCAGGVVPAYNVPGVTGDLKFTGPILAGIYLGTITTWNDPQIAAANPGVNLPAIPITPAYRSDGSGTTFIWTNYLATQSDNFKTTVGASKQVKFPVGQGGGQNAGVAAIVKQTPGAIGYIEQNYADKNGIAYGLVQNKSGKFVKASIDGVSAAGTVGAGTMNGNVLKASIWNQAGDDVYPISGFTYLIAYKDLSSCKTKEQAQEVVNFLWFATHDGQKAAPGLFYAPLSAAVQQKVEAAIANFTFQGAAIKPQP